MESTEIRMLQRITQVIMFILCLSALTACSTLQLSTLWSLKDVDLLHVNPGEFRLALTLPEGANILSVPLIMQMKVSDQETYLINQTFDLDIITSGQEVNRIGLPYDPPNLFVLRVPPSKVDEVVRFQNLMKVEQNSDRDGFAKFGVNSKIDPAWIKSYCENDGRPLQLSAWVLVDEQQGYMPLIKDSQIAKVLDFQTHGVCAQENIDEQIARKS